MWKVRFSPRVESDVALSALWYESKQAGLGHTFVDEVVKIWRELAENPWLAVRKHPTKNLRWCFPKRFPHRIIYEIDGKWRVVVVLCVIHAARDQADWLKP